MAKMITDSANQCCVYTMSCFNLSSNKLFLWNFQKKNKNSQFQPQTGGQLRQPWTKINKKKHSVEIWKSVSQLYSYECQEDLKNVEGNLLFFDSFQNRNAAP